MGKFDERIEEFGLLVGDHERARRVEDIELARILPRKGDEPTVGERKEFLCHEPILLA